MRFTKMQGCGNDYLYVYGEVPENAGDLSHRLSDRHFGAGSDGMIFITPSESADFCMRIFNADGSEAKMCGNGIRCVGKYVYDKGHTDKTVLKIDTLSGVRTLRLHVEDGSVKSASVDMGRADAGAELALSLDGGTIRCTPVSVGNPHAVVFADDMSRVPVDVLGPEIETHEAFPGRVNVEFVQVLSAGALRMCVWERGSGITLACGTGACAAAAAAVKKGFCPASCPITVILDGGELEITVEEDGQVTMSGPAETVYEGEILKINR